MKYIKIILMVQIICILLLGCATEDKSEKIDIKNDVVEEQKDLEDKDEYKKTEKELFELLDIEKYEYPSEFEITQNLKLLLENMAINYKNYNADYVFDEEKQLRFVHNFCQNSWNCIDYVYDSLDCSNGILHKADVEYIQYSLSGKYIEFEYLDDDVEIDVNDCSSGFLYAELSSYEVISTDVNIVLRVEFEISDNSNEEAEVTLIKNEYSCFDGYSVESFNVIGI